MCTQLSFFLTFTYLQSFVLVTKPWCVCVHVSVEREIDEVV